MILQAKMKVNPEKEGGRRTEKATGIGKAAEVWYNQGDRRERRMIMATVVLLAGGKSRRMGTDKLLLPQREGTVLDQAVRRFSAVFDRVCVSVAKADSYPEIRAEHVVDEYPGCGPMAGVHAGLKRCGDDGVFVAAADLPLSDPGAALRIIERCPADAEICVPTGPDGRPEPLFGYYRASVLPRAEELLRAGKYRMRDLLAACVTRFLTPEETEDILDAAGFANMNTPEDYRRLLGGDIGSREDRLPEE